MSRPSRRKLITIDEAVETKKQHTSPCSDCPWARESLKGWLGGIDADTWLQAAHGEEQIDCHTIKDKQCAGAAIYRANCLKRTRPGSGNIVLPKDAVKVFAGPAEFLKHHTVTKKK